MSATSGTRLPPIFGGYDSQEAAVFSGPNPYGPNGQFRTITINYNMNIKVFKYNNVGENMVKFVKYMLKD